MTPSQEAAQLSSDGAWSWFNDPLAIYQHASGVNWLHLGVITSRGSVTVLSHNLDTLQTHQSTLHAALEVDDHDAPSLAVMGDGTVLACYSKHGVNDATGIYMRRTTDPADPTSWGAESQLVQTVSGDNSAVYPRPTRFSSGRVMILYRGAVGKTYLVYSDNGGSSWSTPFAVLASPSQRPYVTLAYAPAVDTIDIVYTSGHPRESSASLWHITLDGAGNARKSDGTLIRNVISGAEVAYSEGTRIYGTKADAVHLIRDGYSSDTLTGGKYTQDAGDGTLLVSGGQLAPSSSGEKRLFRNDREYGDCEVTGRYQTGSTLANMAIGPAAKRKRDKSHLFCRINGAGGATGLQVGKWTANGGVTVFASAAFAPFTSTAYWIRLRTESDVPFGARVTGEVYTSPPPLVGTGTGNNAPVASVTAALTGADVASWWDGVVGLAGHRLIPASTSERYDDLTVVPIADAWGWDVARDPGSPNVIHVLFTLFPGTTDHRDAYARWDGSRWLINPDMLRASAGTYIYSHPGEPNYSPGLALNKGDPGTAYVSRQTQRKYEQEVLADNPLAYYRLSETSGPMATDLVGVNHGTYVNTPTLGAKGALANDEPRAVQFAAAQSEELTLPGPVLSTNAAVEFWFKWTSGVALMRDGGNWLLGFDAGGAFAVRFGDGATRVTSLPTASVRNGTWHHFVLNKAGGTGEVWVDGVRVLAVASGLGNTAAAMPWRVGRNGRYLEYSNATFDELAIYPAALSGARIAAHHTAALRGPVYEIEGWRRTAANYSEEVIADRPLAYYRLGETAGTRAADSAPDGLHDGRYVNSPTLGAAGAGAADANPAVQFSAASSQRVDLTNLGQLGSHARELTAEFWVKTTDRANKTAVFGTVNSGLTLIVACYLNADNTDIGTQPGKTMLHFRGQNGPGWGGHITADIYDGAWHHVVWRLEGPNVAHRCWVDGTEVPVTMISTPTTAASGGNFEFPMMIGARNNRGTADRYANAAVDEVAFYDYRLPEHRIRVHHEAYAGASVRWAFDSAITSDSNTKNVRPRGPKDPGVLTVAAPSVAWLSGTYLSYVDFSTAVKMAGTAGATVLLREDGRFADRPRLMKQGGRFTNRAVE